MGEKQIKAWGVVQVQSGRLAGVFETQTEALERMHELAPAYIVCFGNGFPRPDDFFWKPEERSSPALLQDATLH